MDDQMLVRYSRHLLLDGFEEEGQQRLLNAHVLIVGAGGLGCPAAMYLAASGLGRLTLVDDDIVDLSNLQRQIGHNSARIGLPKVQSLAQTLQAINPHCAVTGLLERLDAARLAERVAEADLVLDCSDNFSTRLAVNRACVAAGKPLVSGAAIRAEGQVAVFNQTPESACYACLYGEDGDDDEATCSNSGVLSPVVGVVGAMQAVEAIKILSGYGNSLDGRLLLLDLKNGDWRKMYLGKDPACRCCAATDDTGEP